MSLEAHLEAFGSCAVIAAGHLCMKLAVNRHGPLLLWKRPMFLLGFLFACSGQVVTLVALVFDLLMSPFILGAEWRDFILGVAGLVGSSLIIFFGVKAVPNPLVPIDWVGWLSLGLVAAVAVLSCLYLFASTSPYGPPIFAASLIALGSTWVDRYQEQQKQHKAYVILLGLIFYVPAAVALSEVYARQRGMHAGRVFYFVWTALQSSLCAILCSSFHKHAKDEMTSVIGLFVSAAFLCLCPALPLYSGPIRKPDKKKRPTESASSEEAETLMDK